MDAVYQHMFGAIKFHYQGTNIDDTIMRKPLIIDVSKEALNNKSDALFLFWFCMYVLVNINACNNDVCLLCCVIKCLLFCD